MGDSLWRWHGFVSVAIGTSLARDVRAIAARVGDVRPSSMDEFITTTGSGTVSTGPDAMRVLVAVEASAPTVAEALATVAEAARRATEVARRHTEPNRIASQGFRVHPSHDHRGRADGYAASHVLRIHCQLADAGAMVSDLGESVGDALRIHEVGPVLTDTGDLRNRARELAFAEAQAKAVHLAQLAGRSLGRALQVREGGPSHSPVAMAASLAHESVGFEQGEEQVTAEVTVQWALTD